MLTDTVLVYTRTAETENWVLQQTQSIRCRITPLSASGARRESRLPDPDITHTCRMLPNTLIAAGQRLQRQSDEAEFIVKATRTQDKPGQGQLIVGLAEAEKTLT
jgi:hypothetical protein